MNYPRRGVYVFSENGKALYVGRSDNIRRRLHDHCRGSSGPNKAAFARLIACRELDLKPDYGPGRDKLTTNSKFMRAFEQAKERVSKMEFRAVAEEDPTWQALLEIYCAVETDAEFNDFANH